MKAVMISIQPKWIAKIVNGEKTIEVRKTAPKLETPFKCYIYETKSKDNETYRRYKVERASSGKVIGEFVCDKVKTFNYITKRLDNCEYKAYNIHNTDLAEMCLSKSEVWEYGKGKSLYGLHISDLKIYDKPKEISEFFQPCSQSKNLNCDWLRKHNICACSNKRFLTRPPQSYFFVEELSI